MSIDKSLEITPRLNPAYWDGHSFGVGDTSRELHPYTTVRGARAAAFLLQDHILGSKHVLDSTPFEVGETFDVSDHEPGTIVVWQHEDLHAHGRAGHLDPQDFLDVEIPAKPALYEDDLLSDGVRFCYFTKPVIGAIAKSGIRRRNVLYGSFLTDIIRHDVPSPHVHIEGDILVSSPKLAVGKVNHLFVERSGLEPEAINRVTELRVYTPHKRQTKTFPSIAPSTRRLSRNTAQ